MILLLRLFSVYSMGNRSQQRILCHKGGKKKKLCHIFFLVDKFFFLSETFEDFSCFWTEKLPIWGKNYRLLSMPEGKIK